LTRQVKLDICGDIFSKRERKLDDIAIALLVSSLQHISSDFFFFFPFFTQKNK
jgi:hypothetical protein